MTQEALKLALEALEEAWYHVGTFQPTEKAIDLYDEARTAIKEALAQPEQEPVAKVIDWGVEGPRLQGSTNNWPVVGTLLYTTPPQRTWAGLTDDEIDEAWHKSCTMDNGTHAVLTNQPFYHLAKLVEAKLKEKNI